jgi:hypothetical protein
MRKTWIGALAVGGGVVVAACGGRAGGGSEPGAGAEAVAQASAPATADSAFAFFAATHSRGEYRVFAVNGASFACGKETVTSCLVSAVDLSALDVSPEIVTTLLDQIGDDATSPQLLFAGSLLEGTLAVQEVWRAPVAARLGGELLQVSHAPERALIVNQWVSTPIGALDFSGAPGAEDCETGDGGATACEPSLIPVETDVALPAGVLLEGWTGRNGTLHVQQYFLNVTFGLDQLGDGYSYCQDGQTLCPTGQCSDLVCKNGHGGHGMVAIYQRSGVAAFDAWLIATGQLLPGDIP